MNNKRCYSKFVASFSGSDRGSCSNKGLPSFYMCFTSSSFLVQLVLVKKSKTSADFMTILNSVALTWLYGQVVVEFLSRFKLA